jgi:hypothetical protein
MRYLKSFILNENKYFYKFNWRNPIDWQLAITKNKRVKFSKEAISIIKSWLSKRKDILRYEI